VTGGLITFSVILILVVFSMNILHSTFNRETYEMTTTYKDALNNTENPSDSLENRVIGDFKGSLFNFKVFILTEDLCENITMAISNYDDVMIRKEITLSEDNNAGTIRECYIDSSSFSELIE
jgi:hypothetical protein